MTPPSLTVAREILVAHVASGRERPDLEAAIRVVLARLAEHEPLVSAAVREAAEWDAAGAVVEAMLGIDSGPHATPEAEAIRTAAAAPMACAPMAGDGHFPPVTDLRLQEISESLTVQDGGGHPIAVTDEMRSMGDELQEQLAQPSRDRHEIAACYRAAGGDRGSDERLSEYITRLRRTPRTVPLLDADGRKIGDAVVDGVQVVARVTDQAAAAEIRASAGPRNVSVGYRVDPEPPRTRSRAAPATRGPGPDEPVRTIAVDGGVALDMPAFHAARRATTHGTAIPPEALVDDMLPCPFCRSDLHVVELCDSPELLGFTMVKCRACGAAGPAGRARDERESIANWNRRPAERGSGFRWSRSALPPRASSAAPFIDTQTVRILGRGMGFGRLMQIVEEQWRDVAGDGSELTVGPCAGLLVPCICAAGEPCDWCGGSRRITARVRDTIPIAIG